MFLSFGCVGLSVPPLSACLLWAPQGVRLACAPLRACGSLTRLSPSGLTLLSACLHTSVRLCTHCLSESEGDYVGVAGVPVIECFHCSSLCVSVCPCCKESLPAFMCDACHRRMEGLLVLVCVCHFCRQMCGEATGSSLDCWGPLGLRLGCLCSSMSLLRL